MRNMIMRVFLAGLVLATTVTFAQEEAAAEPAPEQTEKEGEHQQLQDYEPDIINLPGLEHFYGIKVDRNHALKIDTQFVMEQIINPGTGTYRNDSLFMNPMTETVPNWFIYMQMDDCYYCEKLAPNVHALAREFHRPDSKGNYVVATINCSEEDSLFMCQYFHITSLPKFLVLRPETENRFQQFPLSYRKSLVNLYTFATAFWEEAYTWHQFVIPEEMDEWSETKHNIKQFGQSVMEEAAGFFLDWGYQWLPYNTVLTLSVCCLVLPFCLLWSTAKSFGFIGQQPGEKQDKGIEDDPDFVMDDSAPLTPTDKDVKKGEKTEKKKDSKKQKSKKNN